MQTGACIKFVRPVIMTRHCCRIGKVSSFQLLISAGPGPYAFGSTPARKPGYMGRAIWVLRTGFLGSVKRSADSVLANPCSAPFPPWLCSRPHRRRCPHSLTQTRTSGSAGATCICGLCSPGAAVRPGAAGAELTLPQADTQTPGSSSGGPAGPRVSCQLLPFHPHQN